MYILFDLIEMICYIYVFICFFNVFVIKFGLLCIIKWFLGSVLMYNIVLCLIWWYIF